MTPVTVPDHVTVADTAAVLVLTATPTTPARPPDDEIGPGIAGFVVMFVLALVVIWLIRDMNRRVRRVRYRRDAAPGGDEPGTGLGGRPAGPPTDGHP